MAKASQGNAMWLTLLVAVATATWAMQPPPPRSSPTSVGSGEGINLDRALTDLREITRQPHITGSPENARVRDFLVARLTAMGLRVEIQRGTAVRQSPRGQNFLAVAQVENIIAILPGRDRSQPAVAAMAHYDSVPFSYGAADDGSGTVAVLETARALASGRRPMRDVIFLITDGEELGLTGAQLFFDDHPLARRIGMVVNAEARGSKGRATMFQTSPGNAALVDLWADHAISPSGNSMSDAIYRLLPNDTDLSVSLGKQVAGINAAFVGGHFDYHSTTDSFVTINRGSLQQLGDFVLTTVRALAMAPTLPATDRDATYFDLFGHAVVAYPPWIGWLPLVLAGAGLGILYRRSGTISIRRKLGGGAGVVGATILLGGISHVIGDWMIGNGSAQMREAMADIDGMIWPMAGLVLGALLVLRPGRAMQLGAMAVLVALGIVAQIFMPGAAFLFAWPTLVAVAMALIDREGQSLGRTVARIALVGVVLGLLFQIMATAYVSVGLLSGGVMALALAFMVALLPAGTNNSGKAGAAVLSLSFGLIAWMAMTDGFSERHPRPGDFFALYNADDGRAYWATTSDNSYLPDGATVERFRFEPFGRWRVMVTPAAGVAVPAAERRVAVSAIATQSGRRWDITIAQPPRMMMLAFRPSKPLTNARLNGRGIDLPTTRWTQLYYRVPQPITMQLTADGPADAVMEIRYLLSTPGLPVGAPRDGGLATNWTMLTGTQVVVGSWPAAATPARQAQPAPSMRHSAPVTKDPP